MATFDVCLLMDDGFDFWFDDATCWLLDRIVVNEIASACGKVEISLDNVAWLNISGQTQSIAGTTQSRKYEDYFIFDDEEALIGGGRREPFDLIFAVIYTETDAEVYEVVRHRFEDTSCANTLYVRWSPGGGNAGDEIIISEMGELVGFTYPPIDAAAGGPILGGFRLRITELETQIVAS